MNETMSDTPAWAAGFGQIVSSNGNRDSIVDLRIEMRGTRAEMRVELNNIRNEMRQSVRELRSEARSDFHWLLVTMLVGFAVTLAFILGAISHGH